MDSQYEFQYEDGSFVSYVRTAPSLDKAVKALNNVLRRKRYKDFPESVHSVVKFEGKVVREAWGRKVVK